MCKIETISFAHWNVVAALKWRQSMHDFLHERFLFRLNLKGAHKHTYSSEDGWLVWLPSICFQCIVQQQQRDTLFFPSLCWAFGNCYSNYCKYENGLWAHSLLTDNQTKSWIKCAIAVGYALFLSLCVNFSCCLRNDEDEENSWFYSFQKQWLFYDDYIKTLITHVDLCLFTFLWARIARSAVLCVCLASLQLIFD